MEEVSEKELFETVPVRRAVAALAIPTMISQIVSDYWEIDEEFIYSLGSMYLSLLTIKYMKSE